ncbi:MAG TPA: hypothetical protein ENG48_05825 [Candidatus Atribacteria bacterium]|nr:MAG: hypothetical protein DRZ76_02130 [Candidatus Nealsonbacteria bacterium]HDK26589.1 hypothetical protein [Candidatus Atribacteria bacterium]
METKTLEEAINDILEKIEEKLSDAMQDGGKLSDVKSLMIGMKTSKKPEAPAIWVMEGETVIDTTTRLTNWESWNMDIVIIGVVYNSKEAKEGYKEANTLTARAKNILLADRTLGFGHGSFFTDIKSKRFDGNNPYFQNGNFYSAAFTLTTVFTVRE